MNENAAPDSNGFLLKILTSSSKLGELARRFRRFYYGVWRKEEMMKRIAETRTGECHRCGSCCELVYKCPFLGKDVDQLPYCRIYGDLRPANCHNYPFDRIDSEVKRCGFKFKDASPQGNIGTTRSAQ